MRRVVVANRRDGGWWWRLPILAVIWLSIVAPIVAGGVAVTILRRWARDLPDVPDLDAWREQAPQTSLIRAADGSILAALPFKDGDVFGHRTLAPLEAMPKELIGAVLAAEDVRFYEHKGADYVAIARAWWMNHKAGRIVEGASTITQQVARNLLPDQIGKVRTNERKVREVLLARRIEERWSKRDILETYLDFVFLGEGAYGMVAAARAYFDKDVGDVTLPEAALLAGLIQAPGRLNPWHHADAAKVRRDEILARMMRAHLIDEPTRAAAVATPIALHHPSAMYGRRVPWYAEQVRQLLHKSIPSQVARGGLTIETAALPALGTQLQLDAVKQADAWATKNDGTPQIAAMLWDHRTGYVEALVGGRHWGPDRFDRMRQSCRQPGSAFKPLVYGAALDTGAITPGTPLRDAPISEYDEATNVHWRPKSGNKFRGVVLVQDAFAASLNAPAIDVFDRTGAASIIKLARRLGVTAPLPALRPLALGAACVKPLELARVFAVIARRGWAIAPRFAVRVRRGESDLFESAVPEDPWLDPSRRFDRLAATAGRDPDARISADGGQLLDERTAFQLQAMMHEVTERGTAAAASALGRPVAGKTGTTNDNTDAWFIGFSGRALGAVWIGFDNPVHKLGTEGDGAHAALPLWMKAIRAAEGDRPRIPLPGAPPAGMEEVSIDRESGMRAAAHAGGEALWFRTGTAPTETAGEIGTSPTDFGRSAREF